MELIDREVKCSSRSDVFEFYLIGDVHLGARNCAESPLRRTIKEILENRNTFWIGGGDLVDCISPQDTKRFEIDILPDWMLDGDAITTREQLNDVLDQQFQRMVEILKPTGSKCIGLIEGNHEHAIRKYYNTNIHRAVCEKIGSKDLTDEAVIRLTFKRPHGAAVVVLYIRHGWGSGRTYGAEPNRLGRMLDEWETADVCLSGHSHNFHIMPPKPVMGIPRKGKLPKELTQKYRWAANWGCWLYSHAAGPSSYASRACYPARPMLTAKVVIKPFTSKYIVGQEIQIPHIEIRAITI